MKMLGEHVDVQKEVPRAVKLCCLPFWIICISTKTYLVASASCFVVLAVMLSVLHFILLGP